MKDRTERPLGVTFPLETRRDVIVDAAARTEELGYDAFFVEAWGLGHGTGHRHRGARRPFPATAGLGLGP